MSLLQRIFRKRKYKSGTGWCLWRWTDVDTEYITRLHVLKTPWFAICLHWLNKPDPEPYLHDHPVSFLSVILRGAYAEKRKVGGDVVKLRYHRWFNWIPASREDRHTICAVAPGTLTLCFMGPKTQEWGFHIPGSYPSGDRWIHWKDYYAALRLRVGRQS